MLDTSRVIVVAEDHWGLHKGKTGTVTAFDDDGSLYIAWDKDYSAATGPWPSTLFAVIDDDRPVYEVLTHTNLTLHDSEIELIEALITAEIKNTDSKENFYYLEQLFDLLRKVVQ